MFGPPIVQINGDRATSICHVWLMIRVTLEGRLFDVDSWFRSHDLLVRRGGKWAIIKRVAIYDRDSMRPVGRAPVPPEFYASPDMATLPPACRHLSFMQVKEGRQSSGAMIQVHSDEERAELAEAEAWLGGGKASPLPAGAGRA